MKKTNLTKKTPTKNTENKQYSKNMLKDKRFAQNHTKYLRLKAFKH